MVKKAQEQYAVDLPKTESLSDFDLLGRIVLPDDFAYTYGHGMAKRFIEKAPTIIEAEK